MVYCLFGIACILSWFNTTMPFFDGSKPSLRTANGWKLVVNQLFESPVTSSLTIDLFFVALSLSIWIVFDHFGRMVCIHL
jgi:hypothetical protein